MCPTKCPTLPLKATFYRVQRFNALLRIYYIYDNEKIICLITVADIFFWANNYG